MREFLIEASLKKKMQKLCKKNKAVYESLTEKMQEILECQDVERYKNLRQPLQHLKRVHIKGSFVLVFSYIKPEDKIIFYNFDHHDNIYR